MASTPAPGEIIPVSKSAGYIILSYVVSYVGCLTALELLVRRTHHGGHYNWFLLGGAATAMGGVAIWSMHYIGMQAMIMGNGEDELQLYYYASYTAGSFFLPIAVVSLSFSVFSSSRKASAWRIAVAGGFCGGAICGMHYLGQIGIVNYEDVWNWWYVFGSVIIALSAATIALGVFFYLSAKWINALWKRALCAILLAGAVCLMHWTAILGTSFRWKGRDTALPPGLSKTSAVWVCGALAVSCCFVLLGLAIIFQYVRRKYTQKTQQISLALAYFTPDGNIMLNNAGHLPLNKITKNYLAYSTKDNFDVDTAPFAWMFRVSRNWSCVNGILPSMRLHLQLEQAAEGTDYITNTDAEKPCSYLTILKELYCVAADDLAHAVGLPLAKVGCLFDRILDTGRMTPHMKVFNQAAPTITTDSDVESGLRIIRTTLTRGQVLFLVRHLSLSEVNHLQTLGFSFAPPKNVISSVSVSMHITSQELRPYLDALVTYKEMPQMLETGVHLAMFVVKPIIGGFEILANKSIRNQLPSLDLPIQKLETWQVTLLAQYNHWEASALLMYWTSESTRSRLTDSQDEFITCMCDAMIQLQNRVGNHVFDTARFIAKPFHDAGLGDKLEDTGTTTILAFKFVTDIHYVHPGNALDAFVNARLFTTQQYCYPGSSDHTVFAGRVHAEFSAIPGITGWHSKPEVEEGLPNDSYRKLLKQSLSFPRTIRHGNSARSSKVIDQRDYEETVALAHNRQNRSSLMTDDPRQSEDYPSSNAGHSSKSSDKNLLHKLASAYSDQQSSSTGSKPRSLFAMGGGVHVSNEVHVTIADARTGSSDKIEMSKLGTKTTIGTVQERESIVDTLMSLTLGELRA